MNPSSHPALPELGELERAIEAGGSNLNVRTSHCGDGLPVHVIALGNPSHEVPGFGVFAGVHGLERIGSQVVIAWLWSLVQRLRWDTTLHLQLQQVRLLLIPLVNPGGMLRGTRANPAGVDLMRNAPIDATDRVPPFVGGHRVSARLPWYRGRAGAAMEPESAVLCEAVERELHGRPLGLVLDCHSGFGLRDRLWFPFAHSRRPMPQLAELHALFTIYTDASPQHPYVIEPQSQQYLTHGDLWDHLFLRSLEHARGPFLPLTLEMGSWLWVKKNPRQVFSRFGIFNPLLAHRQERVLRRHLPLLDFLMRATVAAQQWLPSRAARDEHERAALQRWYHAA